MQRRVVRTLVVLGVGLVVAGLAGLLALRGSLPRLDGEIAAPGLGARATLERDDLGVVTVDASSRADAAFALGFAHAQDRWFQMDLARRLSAGRLAELVGDAALETDRRNRLHRFEAVADRVLAGLPPEHRTLLDAYTAGVNAGLASLRVRPVEYLLLRAQPRPWTPRDTLLVVYTMFLQLNDARGESDRQRGLIRDSVPPGLFRFLYSVAPGWESPIDGQVAAAEPIPGPEVLDLRRRAALASTSAAHTSRPATDAAPRTGFEPRAVGSNSWGVAGTHTASGAGLVANDMHLGLALPNTWYRARIRVDGPPRIDATGVTLPGAPLLIAGSTGRIAWAYTNSYGDYTDLVLVEVSADGTRYRSADGWRPLERQVETLRSSSGRSETLELTGTEWGPLLEQTSGGRRLALHWTAHDPAALNLNLLGLETAAGVDEALAIAPTVGVPVQNFVVADASGRLAWTLLGRLPLRGPGYEPGVPADWTRPGAGWQGWRPADRYPRVVDPPSGRLWTANNRVVGGEALAAIGDGSPDRGARAQQIAAGLAALPRATERDMLAIQLDDRALFLAPWRERLLALLDAGTVGDDRRLAEFRREIEDWQGRAAAEDAGYRLVRSFHETLQRRVFDLLTTEVRRRYPEAALRVPRQFEWPLEQLVGQRPAHLLDPRYADWDAWLLSVVDETIANLERDCPDGLARCTWGRRNAVRIRHPLSPALPPALARWLDVPSVPMSGDGDMPHVHAPGFGASERFAVSPGREADGYFHMPGGQSGHPLSPWYRAGHDAWLRGEPTPFLPGTAAHRLVLAPAAAP